MERSQIEALTFDVFGTVVDTRGSLVRHCGEIGNRWGLKVVWPDFVDEWQAQYPMYVSKVRESRKRWKKLSVLLRHILEELLRKHGVQKINNEAAEELCRVWSHLDPWPDVLSGLRQLKTQFILATLSNADVSMTVENARFSNLPWDVILGAEVCGRFKPDPQVYLRSVKMLSLKPSQCLMVSSHNNDLEAASALGFRTAFIPRPTQYGPHQTRDLFPEHQYDFVADSFIALADKTKA